MLGKTSSASRHHSFKVVFSRVDIPHRHLNVRVPENRWQRWKIHAATARVEPGAPRGRFCEVLATDSAEDSFRPDQVNPFFCR